MVDDKDRTPDLPLGEAWRFALGARYDWSKKLAFGVGSAVPAHLSSSLVIAIL
jgi:long-subunit fatty acid transport protein